MEGRPLCKCHGEPMWWNKDTRTTADGYWRCSVKKREHARAYVRANPEKSRERWRRWQEENRDWLRHRDAGRIWIFGASVGRVGFTKREWEEMPRG